MALPFCGERGRGFWKCYAPDWGIESGQFCFRKDGQSSFEPKIRRSSVNVRAQSETGVIEVCWHPKMVRICFSRELALVKGQLSNDHDNVLSMADVQGHLLSYVLLKT